MAAQGRNEGFHVLDDFVCEAIHAPSVSLANPRQQGRNEGMEVIEELVFDSTLEAAQESGGTKPRGPIVPNDAIKSEVKRLAAFISESTDPVGTTILFQNFLVDELARIRNKGDAPGEGRRSESSNVKPA